MSETALYPRYAESRLTEALVDSPVVRPSLAQQSAESAGQDA